MKILVNGANGKMGKEVVALAERGYRNSSLAGKVDKYSDDCLSSLYDFEGDADVIIDFSNHLATNELCCYAAEKGLPVVIATTGHTEEELSAIKKAAEKIPVFLSANMSVGVALLCELARQTAKIFPDADIEIIEKHHNRKLDAPSGTAIMIADSIKKEREKAFYVYGREGHRKREADEIGIHAVRMGDVIGEHEILVGTDAQTITLKHQAHSRALFADGAVVAADFIKDLPAGLYDMQSMLKKD